MLFFDLLCKQKFLLICQFFFFKFYSIKFEFPIILQLNFPSNSSLRFTSSNHFTTPPPNTRPLILIHLKDFSVFILFLLYFSSLSSHFFFSATFFNYLFNLCHQLHQSFLILIFFQRLIVYLMTLKQTTVVGDMNIHLILSSLSLLSLSLCMSMRLPLTSLSLLFQIILFYEKNQKLINYAVKTMTNSYLEKAKKN